MPNNFEILAGFLERFGDDVEGHESAALPPAVADQLRRFARGQLPETEQGEVIRELNGRTEWVKFLAAEVKALRSAGPQAD